MKAVSPWFAVEITISQATIFNCAPKYQNDDRRQRFGQKIRKIYFQRLYNRFYFIQYRQTTTTKSVLKVSFCQRQHCKHYFRHITEMSRTDVSHSQHNKNISTRTRNECGSRNSRGIRTPRISPIHHYFFHLFFAHQNR